MPTPAAPTHTPPPSRRLTQRFEAVLGAVVAELELIEDHPENARMPLGSEAQAGITHLLDTAEAALARHLPPHWRKRWPANQMVTGRDARIELLMALHALVMVLKKLNDQKPPQPIRKPRRHTIVGREVFGPPLPLPLIPDPPEPPPPPPEPARPVSPRPPSERIEVNLGLATQFTPRIRAT
ncbi:hypothetical protein [Devosia sp.]|uniref:hypothetical protein n=1 Tax=Devosia sp. TaxID=1871048 RepID=UPI003BAA7473